MGSVPVSAVEYPNSISIYGGEWFVVADEAMLIINLRAVISKFMGFFLVLSISRSLRTSEEDIFNGS